MKKADTPNNDLNLQFIVYRHQSPSGKNYIGITSQTPEGRWRNGSGYSSQTFHNAINKYGWDSFFHYLWTGQYWAEYPSLNNEKPYICDFTEASMLEQKFIKEFDSIKNGYNCSPGGERLTSTLQMRTNQENGWFSPPVRSLTCNHCFQQYDPNDLRSGIFTTCRCGITGRQGSVKRGLYCLQFTDRISESWTETINGYMVRSKQVEDYRTKNQWLNAGYYIKPEAIGTEMYATMFAAQNNGRRYVYYLPSEVE